MRESFRMGNSYHLDEVIKRKIILRLELTDPLGLADVIAEEFTKQYYMYINKQRNMISSLYLDNATLTFNTTDIVGKDNIQKFWLDKLSSEAIFTVLSVSHAKRTPGPLTYTFRVRGEVKYKGRSTRFSQFLVITKQNVTGKIIKDYLRVLP